MPFCQKLDRPTHTYCNLKYQLMIFKDSSDKNASFFLGAPWSLGGRGYPDHSGRNNTNIIIVIPILCIFTLLRSYCLVRCRNLSRLKSCNILHIKPQGSHSTKIMSSFHNSSPILTLPSTLFPSQINYRLGREGKRLACCWKGGGAFGQYIQIRGENTLLGVPLVPLHLVGIVPLYTRYYTD